MNRSFGLVFLSHILICSLPIVPQSPSVAGARQVRIIALKRSLHIPLIKSALTGSGVGSESSSPSLGFTPGGVDELPEGPEGFDVLDDGRLIIADPIRLRVALFDSNGLYQRSWPIGFAADSITVGSDGAVLIREAKTSKVYSFDLEGKQRAGATDEIAPAKNARLTNSKNGVVDRGCGQPIAVNLDGSDSSMLSLEDLATEVPCVTFVALEASAHGGAPDAIDVRKLVRRYASDGQLVAETTDLPLDYYIIPVNELRVRHGVVYQLRTTSTDVSINEWDTN